MRILFLSDLSLNHTHRWVEYFHDAGHETHLITFEGGRPVPGNTYFIQSNLPRTFMLKYLAHVGTVRKLTRQIKPDIVSAQELGSYGPLGVLCGVRPVAASAWGTDVLLEPGWSWLHRKRIEFVLKRADLITSMADHMTERIVALGGDRGKVVVNHFGVDADIFTMTDRPPRPADEVVLIHTRHFKPVYNFEQLLAALPEVFATLPKARLEFLSDGVLRPKIEAQVRDMGLAKRVSFLGSMPLPDVAARLRDADIFITTSRSDGANISVLEAMAAGAYPVVADIPATRQWFDAGAQGLAVPLDDAAALARGIIEAARDPARRERAREVNRNVVLEKGLWRDNMKRSEEAFVALAERWKKLK
ncbi:MAG: glycosyltransferase family 4 protein [Candidatus Zixiibacteriota bacterium]|jgi:glycosyltransferase involved in cell wall biosynthesis